MQSKYSVLYGGSPPPCLCQCFCVLTVGNRINCSPQSTLFPLCLEAMAAEHKEVEKWKGKWKGKWKRGWGVPFSISGHPTKSRAETKNRIDETELQLTFHCGVAYRYPFTTATLPLWLGGCIFRNGDIAFCDCLCCIRIPFLNNADEWDPGSMVHNSNRNQYLCALNRNDVEVWLESGNPLCFCVYLRVDWKCWLPMDRGTLVTLFFK